jgi:predicted DNA binding CopG/RHH family protein
MSKKPITMPEFANEAEESDWWASRQGRDFVKQNADAPARDAAAPKGSRLVRKLNRIASVQIALRLPETDLTKARELATRKGVGYQTLLKMLVHEGLRREARRA